MQKVIYKNLNIELNFKYLKKILYNKKEKKIITIHSNGIFYTWKIFFNLVYKKKNSFCSENKQRMVSAIKYRKGKIGYLDLSGEITIINIFFMKKMLIIKNECFLKFLHYKIKHFFGVNDTKGLYLFSKKKFQICIFILIRKNRITHLCKKKFNTILCIHQNQSFSELNIDNFKIQKKILTINTFDSKIRSIRTHEPFFLMSMQNGDIFIFNNSYYFLKKIKNNQKSIGKIYFSLKFYKFFFYYSTSSGFLCILNSKKLLKRKVLIKKVSQGLLLNVYSINKNFLSIDKNGNYFFFRKKNFFEKKNFACMKICIFTQKDMFLKKNSIVFYFKKFFWIWVDFILFFNRKIILAIKIDGIFHFINFFCLNSKRNIIIFLSYSTGIKKYGRFFKLKRFKNIYLFLELNISIKKKKVKAFFFDEFFFSSFGILYGTNKKKNKIFIIMLKNKILYFFFLKIPTRSFIKNSENFLKLVFFKKKLLILTKTNSLLIFNYDHENFLFYENKFLKYKNTKPSLNTIQLKKNIIGILLESKKIELYIIKKKSINKLKNYFILSEGALSFCMCMCTCCADFMIVGKNFKSVVFFSFFFYFNHILKFFPKYILKIEKSILTFVNVNKTWRNKSTTVEV